jgi:choline dehydrogenase-like flavoprotein
VLTDAWGIPAAHIVCEWKQEDLALASAGRQAAREIVEAGGGVCTEVTELFYTPLVTGHIRKMQKEWTLSTPGMFVHEVGGARMGADSRSSVLDPWARAWDVPNLYVTDGACWPTSGWQNPTLTEMAVTARSCEHAAQQLRRERSLARAG